MVLPEMDADIEIRSSTVSLELSPRHHSSTDKDCLSASGKLKFDSSTDLSASGKLKFDHGDSDSEEDEGGLDVDVGLEVEAEGCGEHGLDVDIGLEVEADVSLEHGLDVHVGLEVEAEVCADDDLEVDENLLHLEAGLEGEAPLSPHGQQPEAKSSNSQRV